MRVLTKPKFSKASFEKIRDIFIHSYEQKKDSAQQVAMRRLKQAIYHKHPYGWSLDEMIAYINGLTIEDIERLHARYVCSSQMVLSMSGDIEPAFAEQMAIECSEQWQRGSYSPPVYPARQESSEKEIAIPMLRDQVVVAYGRPSSITMHDPKHIGLDLLSYICFHSLGSKLFTLRERTGLFYTAAGGWGIDIHQEHGFDYLYAIVSPENLKVADEAIMKLLEEIAENGVTKQELNAARQLYTKEMIDATTDVRTLASLFANIETMGIGYDYYDKALQVVHEMSAEQISKLASDYVNTDHFVRVTVGRESDSPVANDDASQSEA
jgi:zinc protease